MLKRPLAAVLAAVIVSSCSGGSSPTTPSPTASCTISPAQSSVSIGAAGGSTVVTVNTSSSCAWTVTSSQSWLTITSGTGGTGTGTVTFTAAENTGSERTAIVTVGGVPVTVTQAAGSPIVFNPAPPNPTVGQPYSYTFTATGGTGTFRYEYETGVGFPPNGITLNNQSGVLSGTTTSTNAATFGVCAIDTAGRSVCRRVTLTPSPATTSGAFVGTWRGTIVLQAGCTTPLPQNLAWTGTFRTAGTGYDIVVSVPLAFISNEVYPVTINGQRLSFSLDFEGPLNFVADFSSDFRSLSGTFVSPQKCNINPPDTFWSGTWNGTKQ